MKNTNIVPFASAGLVAGAALLAPATARADGPKAHDVVTYEESVPDRGMIVTGVILLGGTYGASAIVGSVSDVGADRSLLVPVVGPWVDLANRDACDAPRDCSGETRNRVLLVADGIGQALGALQIVGGFAFPSKRTVTTTSSIRVTPSVPAGGGFGLSARAAF